MSEKRFGYGETDLFEWVEDNGKMISTKECVNKLNEQQELIEELHSSDNMGWGRAEKFEKELKQKKIYIKRLEYKVQKFKEMNSEQQDTIDKQELRLQHIEELLELSENLNKSYREKLIDMNLKMVIDDE